MVLKNLDAVEFVERTEGKNVVLIDGDQLAVLMIEHGLGVTTTKTYEIREVSNDFFDESEGGADPKVEEVGASRSCRRRNQPAIFINPGVVASLFSRYMQLHRHFSEPILCPCSVLLGHFGTSNR